MSEPASGTSVGTLVLGIGNVLLGDEGVGVYVVRHLQSRPLPADVTCLDGGTGSFTLLGPLQSARRVLMVDATSDGRPPGTVGRLRPRFSRDFPRTLTAHDIGLKDMIDAMYLLGSVPDITLFTVSIDEPGDIGMGLSDAVSARVPEVADLVLQEIGGDGVPVPD